LGECVISLDADGQHPPYLIPHLIEHWQQGYDVVTTRRLPDPTLPASKRLTSTLFYRVLRQVSRLNLQEGEADFRLLDRKVIEALRQHRETDLFLRGTVAWMGFRQLTIPYQPATRFAGQTKYSIGKMMRLALSGITSFTTRPLYLSVVVGLAMSVFSGLYGLVVLYEKYFTNRTVSGWTSIVLLILLLGGFQFIMMGIIGVYLGKTFEEAQGRPPYLIAQTSELMASHSYAWTQPAESLV
ncbi:MAG: glycosyltransferase, partial [Rudanella sp.]|nr:glycosyltransferase [Rudanella sp.]